MPINCTAKALVVVKTEVNSSFQRNPTWSCIGDVISTEIRVSCHESAGVCVRVPLKTSLL